MLLLVINWSGTELKECSTISSCTCKLNNKAPKGEFLFNTAYNFFALPVGQYNVFGVSEELLE